MSDPHKDMLGRNFGGESFGGEGGPVDWMPADEQLVHQINERFTHHPALDANAIVVTCREGLVTLQGAVRSHEAKALAEGLAKEVPGVLNVRNEIQVKGPRVA